AAPGRRERRGAWRDGDGAGPAARPGGGAGPGGVASRPRRLGAAVRRRGPGRDRRRGDAGGAAALGAPPSPRPGRAVAAAAVPPPAAGPGAAARPARPDGGEPARLPGGPRPGGADAGGAGAGPARQGGGAGVGGPDRPPRRAARDAAPGRRG